MKERLNWREACEVLGCSKSTLYRLVANGQLRAFGVGSRGRWYSRTECQHFVLEHCLVAGTKSVKAGGDN
ncbi:helix-turn-helix domain-containing protein [uncultured Desulfovibrio sp.]|uniref:helix-turn-helix domain-containing protein n=1 Tax=uncultured Desulfovibrio sp. TaxID=167968 RepID=UPI0028057F5A|nr:helix-turn-helix domain-containing protein [uncultured Desulfovibrio sp.]